MQARSSPAPGMGLLGPPQPNPARLSLARPCPPSVRRSGRRSCRHHRDLDGHVAALAFKLICGILSFKLRLLVATNLTGMGYFNIYPRTSTGHHPPGPPARDKWPILALGGQLANSGASRLAPRAALGPANGWPCPPSPPRRQPAREGPPRAPSRALAHHPRAPPTHALPAHPPPGPLRPRWPAPPLLSLPRATAGQPGTLPTSTRRADAADDAPPVAARGARGGGGGSEAGYGIVSKV